VAQDSSALGPVPPSVVKTGLLSSFSLVDRPALFIDDGGVMNENARRATQWARLVAHYLVPLLGGAPEAWAAANSAVAVRLFQDYEAYFSVDPGASWSAYWATYEDDWLSGMCAAVGVEPPADRAARLRLSRDCNIFVTRRVRAPFPGVVGVIRDLHVGGFTLRTASGETSWDLDGYLTGMGVRSCFAALYGADQVDAAKASALFYERVFVHAAIAPTEALVVDDAEQALNWAAEVGARTVLCNPDPPASARHLHIRQLADLPVLLKSSVP
jgi:FMN phosphatase YigB (HAD superfamily)